MHWIYHFLGGVLTQNTAIDGLPEAQYIMFILCIWVLSRDRQNSNNELIGQLQNDWHETFKTKVERVGCTNTVKIGDWLNPRKCHLSCILYASMVPVLWLPHPRVLFNNHCLTKSDCYFRMRVWLCKTSCITLSSWPKMWWQELVLNSQSLCFDLCLCIKTILSVVCIPRSILGHSLLGLTTLVAVVVSVAAMQGTVASLWGTWC